MDLRQFVARFALCNGIAKGDPVLNKNNNRVLKFLPAISFQTLYIPVTLTKHNLS